MGEPLLASCVLYHNPIPDDQSNQNLKSLIIKISDNRSNDSDSTTKLIDGREARNLYVSVGTPHPALAVLSAAETCGRSNSANTRLYVSCLKVEGSKTAVA